jgi:outer membrane receptor protein involved in Fe transport
VGRRKLLQSGAVVLSLCSVAEAAEAAPRHRFELPAGRLGDALVALGRQSGTSIGISQPELAGRYVSRVSGYLTVEQALRQLLRGKQAGYAFIDPSTVRVFQKAERLGRASAPPQRTPQRPAAIPRPQRPPKIRMQPAPPEDPLDIVVTASKRVIGVGSYPGAVRLVDSEALLPDGALAGTSALLARLPALTSTHFGPGRNKLFIRGIADSSFSGPTQATVGQYLGETRLNYNAPDPDLRLYDMDRVEVLAGPHGTLYGAGSLGGIVRLIPNAPRLNKIEARASVGGSSTRHGDPGRELAGMLNVPLDSGRLGVRVAGYTAREGGYIDDLERSASDVNRTRIWGGRFAARAEVGDDWTLDLGLTGQQIRAADAQYSDGEAPPLTRRSSVQQPFKNDYRLADFVATKQWDSVRLVATAGVVRQKLLERFDATRPGAAPFVVDQSNEVALLTFESRVSRQMRNGSGWIGGVSFVKNDLNQRRRIGTPTSTNLRSAVDNSVTEGAVFGEGSFKLAEPITVTAGGRITHSRLSGAAVALPSEGSRNETMFLPAAGLAAKPRSDMLLFLRYQEAYRPGGLAIRSQSVQRFRNDRLRAAEAGLRYGAAGISRFDAALSFVYTRWNDVQADVVDPGGAPTTMNVGDGRIYTADLSVGWRPLPGLSLETAAVFNDSVVKIFEPSLGVQSPLPNVARVNARVGMEYQATFDAVDLHVWSAGRYVGQSRVGVGRLLGEKQGGWLDVSFGARARTGRHALALSFENLLDQTGNRFAIGSPYQISVERQITPLRPRTVRLGWEIFF